MKREPWKWIAVGAALMAATTVHAQQPGPRRMMMPERGDNGRLVPPYPPQEQQLLDAQQRELRQHGRMSPEERRQLRRDIDEAGRELYRRNPQRPPQ